MKKNFNHLQNNNIILSNKRVKKIIRNKLISLSQKNKIIHKLKIDNFLSKQLNSVTNEVKKSFIQKFKDEDEQLSCIGNNSPPDHCKSKNILIKSLGSDSTNIEKFINHVSDPLNYFASI